MRKYAILVILTAILMISAGTGCISKDNENTAATSMGQNSPHTEHQLHTNTSNHLNYGLSYPLTYEFSIPIGSSGLKAYKRYSSSDNWIQITEKTSNDFFNGIEAARFDYANNQAYISVAYNSNSDNIFVKITDSSGNSVNTTYNQIDNYYDNRSAVVLATMDDWGGGTSETYDESYIQAFQARNIMLSAAIITNTLSGTAMSDAKWSWLNKDIQAGCVEPVSHSRNHHSLPFADYDSEINGSKQDIINNITMPTVNTMGPQEYVYGWVEPGGKSDAIERAKLGHYGYLADRSVQINSFSQNVIASWDSTNNIYNRHGVSIEADDHNVQDIAPPFPGTDTLNSTFDSIVGINGVYTLYFHPQQVLISELLPHLDYIANRKNIWYVGLGQLYLYDFTHRMATSYIPTVEKQ